MCSISAKLRIDFWFNTSINYKMLRHWYEKIIATSLQVCKYIFYALLHYLALSNIALSKRFRNPRVWVDPVQLVRSDSIARRPASVLYYNILNFDFFSNTIITLLRIVYNSVINSLVNQFIKLAQLRQYDRNS